MIGHTDSLVRWLKTESLPFWASAGLNDRTGLAYEQMDAGGSPDPDALLRVRVQLRQIYAFSHASVLGWLPNGDELAFRLWHRLREVAAPDGLGQGLVHLLSPDGQVSNATRDSYDHAFAVLAVSWLRRATGETKLDTDIDDLMGFVDGRLTDDVGALTEGWPQSLPRRQNPQMHWFEAMLALFEAAGRAEGLERAARMKAFMLHRLLDSETDTIGEFFGDDWRAVDGPMGDTVEPGHLAEWCWLLRRHETLSQQAREPLPSRLLASASRTEDSRTGLLVNECDRQFRVRRGSRRSWLATEYAKAWISEVEAGVPGSAAKAHRALRTMDEHHLRRPIVAGWIDEVDAGGRPVPGKIPTSILYHVFVVVAEADRVLSPLEGVQHAASA
ncbi:MAG: AGE family epimerase/isomerase [Phreatobacter sp.]|uniref:AGE family epimerase/isomerase n=1 Tax=Phreatobacter sp. TaxID=1966341 RepID=UPI00403581D3